MTANVEVARQAEAPGAVICHGLGEPPQPRLASRQRDAILIVALLAVEGELAPVAMFVIALAAIRGLVRESQIIPRARRPAASCPGEIAEPDPGRGRRCGLGLVQFGAGCLDLNSAVESSVAAFTLGRRCPAVSAGPDSQVGHQALAGQRDKAIAHGWDMSLAPAQPGSGAAHAGHREVIHRGLVPLLG